MKISRVIVTGASGYVGKNLKSYISKNPVNGLDFVFLSRNDFDITDQGAVSAFVKENDLVVNLACYDNKRSSLNHKKSFEINTYGVETLCQAVAACNALLLQVSTSEVLNIETQMQVSHESRFNYARHKLYAENIIQSYLPIGSHKTLRLFSTFGGKGSASVIDIFKSNAEEGKQCILSNPHIKRDFVNIYDVCKMIVNLIVGWESNTDLIINFGSGKLTSLKEVVEILLSKYEFDVEYGDAKEALEVSETKDLINHDMLLSPIEEYLL